MTISKWQNSFAKKKRIERTKEGQRFIVHNASEWYFMKTHVHFATTYVESM